MPSPFIPSPNANSQQMDALMGDDQDMAAPPAPGGPAAAPKMVTLQLPTEVAQMLMDSLGQQLMGAAPGAPPPEEDMGAAPPSDSGSDEDQEEGE